MKAIHAGGIALGLTLLAAGFYSYRWYRWDQDRNLMRNRIAVLEVTHFRLLTMIAEIPSGDEPKRKLMEDKLAETLVELTDLQDSLELHEEIGWFP